MPKANKRRAPRSLPRPFTMHWGAGQIIEEATWSGPHHEPSIQLLQYTDGEGAGTYSVRFCFYSPDGRFQRSPLMLDGDAIDGMRSALKKTPRLRQLLRRLTSG